MNQEVFTIYKTTNTVNGKFYIGVHKTANPNDSYLGSGQLLNRAIKKHGLSFFKKEIIHVFETAEEAYDKERELVCQELIDCDQCYNLKIGGLGGLRKGIVRSPETREKMRASKLGKPRSEETKEKLRNKVISEETRQKLRNRVISLEQREKISASLTGRTISEETRQKLKSRTTSEETKTKLREAARTKPPRKPLSEESKERIRAGKLGKVYSEDMKAVMRAKKLATKMAKLSTF